MNLELACDACFLMIGGIEEDEWPEKQYYSIK